MQNKIKYLKTMLACIASLAIVMATACSSNNSSSSSTSAAPNASSTSAVDSPAPSSADPVDLKVWWPMNAVVGTVIKSLSDVPMVQDWGKKTQVNFQFDDPVGSVSDIMQKFGVMIASGNLPDMMINGWNAVSGGPSKMYSDGTIIKLNDLIDKYAPNLKKVLADNPQVAKQLKSDNGDIYVFPHLRYGQYGNYKTFAGPMIRKDILDQLNLKQPTTIDEWEQVLKTIKDKTGMIPFTAYNSIPLGMTTRDFLGAYKVGPEMYVDNGKIAFGPMQPAYKDYLTTMQRWYQEGLIDPDYATNDLNTMNGKITSGKAAAFYGYIGGQMGVYLPALQEANPKADLAALQYPVLKAGDQPAFTNSAWEYAGIGAVITKDNKNPEITIKALDYLYSPEGAMLKNFGTEGTTYTMVNGQPQYTDLILNNPDGLSIAQAMGKYFVANYGLVGPDDDRVNDQYYQLPQQQDALKVYAQYAENAYKVTVPPISLTPDEAKQYSKIMSDITTFQSEQVTKIIMGASQVSDYDQVINQYKEMGIDKAVQIQQAALERYNNR